MKIRHITRKRGGGAREKLFAWVDYVLDHANKNGWPAFSIMEERTNNSGNTNEVEVEIESSIKDNSKHVFPTSHRPMSDEYATGLAMYYWDPQRKTGANRALYKHFESQYQNKPSARSHSPVRGRNITRLNQKLNVVQEYLENISSRAASSSAASSTQPARAPIANRGANNNARIQALALKLHTEQSDARELKELQQKLSEAAMPESLIHRFTISKDDINYKFIKKIKGDNEIILYLVTTDYGALSSRNGAYISYGGDLCLSLVITNKNVYSIRMNKQLYKKNIGNRGSAIISGLYYMPIYTFDLPLNLKQTNILSILSSIGKYRNSGIAGTEGISSGESILYNLKNNPNRGVEYLQAQKELESVIRLIPGSYKNGDWRPMDGFFGLYVNPSTMEINEFPGTELE